MPQRAPGRAGAAGDGGPGDEGERVRRQPQFGLMPAARMAHNAWQTRVTTISATMTVPLKGPRRYIDGLDLPAHEPRMEDGFFVARRTVENRR